MSGVENHADVASRELFPSDLIQHKLWWNGPTWLSCSESTWPLMPRLPSCPEPSEVKEACLHSFTQPSAERDILEKFSCFNRMKRVTAWIFHFISNCKLSKMGNLKKGALTVEELVRSERHWISVSQEDSFTTQISTLKKQALPRKDHLLALNPFIDSHGILRVGGRGSHSEMSYNSRHPVILPGKHPITKLIVRTEHLRLLHAGTTLTAASLSRRYHILGSKRVVRDVVRPCVTCRRVVARPQPQFLGQLPKERLSPGLVFEHTGVDYAGPVLVRCENQHLSRPTSACLSPSQ